MRNRYLKARVFGLLTALFMLAVSTAGAQKEPSKAERPVTPPSTLVIVQRLHDAGGLAAPEKGKVTLNDALTSGLVHYLEDHAHKGFEIRDARRREASKPQPGQSVLTLEGDLSCMAGEAATKDTYLLTIRLFESGQPHRIVAQWSGSARSLLYLTNNMRRDPRFSASGLLGEIGDRVAVTAAAFGTPSRQEQEKKFLHTLTEIKADAELQVKIRLAAETEPQPKIETTLLPGEAYRLEIAGKTAGDVYVIEQTEEGRLKLLYLPQQEKEQPGSGDPSLTPPTLVNWQAPKTSKPTTVEFIVLERERHAKPLSPHVADAVISAPLPKGKSSPKNGEMLGQVQGMGLAEEPDVQVLNGGNRLLPRDSGDSDIARVLAGMQADRPQAWHIARLKVSITPQKVSITSETDCKVLLLRDGINPYARLQNADLASAQPDAERMASFWKNFGDDFPTFPADRAGKL